MTNLHLHLQKAKQIGVKFTVLATSISLAACGGGDGYFGKVETPVKDPGNTGGGTDSAISKEATGITLTVSKDQLNVKGDELTVTAKAVDKDGGGVANKKIVLNIKDALTLGATSDASEKTTNEKGEVTFTVKLSGTNASAQELLLTAGVAGTTINNVRKITISGAGTVVQSQYELRFDAIKSLKVSGGETPVRVRAVDANGGGVPNQDIALAIKDFSTRSDLSIKGLSTAKTDNEGYASFTVQLTAGTEASRAALMQSGVGLVATLTEASGATKTQVSTVGVASVASLVSSLTLSTSDNNKVAAADGSISVIVNAKNPDGLPVANQTVTLGLDEQAIQYGAKLVSSTAKTDANGNATFIVQTQTNSLNPSGQLLVQNGIMATATLQNTEGTTLSAQTTKITVVSVISDEVSYLTVNTPHQIEINGGQAVVTVTAVDKNGGVLSDKSVNLAVKNSAQNGITIKEGSQQTTKEGKATFTLQFNPAGISAATLANLLSNGVDIGVGYAKAIGGTVTQTTRVQFYTKQAANPAVDRLEMAISKGVVNASNDTVEVKVRAIDEKGNAAVNQPVKFEFKNDAAKTSVRFDGASTKNTDGNGYVSYTLHTTAANSEAIDKLIKEGITIQTTSGTTTQTIQVMVQAAAAETVAVSYLSMTADNMININKGQAKVTVKAVDNNGGVLAGRVITLKIADSQKNGLTVDTSKIATDAQGNATFTLSYNGSITDQTLLNQLKGEGVLLTAEYQPANGLASVTQTTRLRYYQQNINADVQQLAINLSTGVAVASNDAMIVTVKAVDEYGQPVIGRKISLGLNDVAKNNGVSLTTGSSVTTDATGEAEFGIKLAAPNSNAINALTAAGVEFTASTEQNNGDRLAQIARLMVAATAQAQADVTYLSVDNLQAINVAQSAERTIRVKALNSSGGIVANKDISLALSKTFTGIRIKEGAKLTTNAAGEAVFTLEYDAAKVSAADQVDLQTQGLTLTASYAGNGSTVSQSTTLAYFALPVNITRMDLVVDKGALVVDSTTAQTVNATAILKDAQGKPVANRQVTLSLDNAALQNGVGFTGVAGGFTVVNTDANGQAPVALTVKPSSKANIDALVGSSIGIGASALQGDGVTLITQSTKVNVLSAATLNEVGYLTATSANSIATTGGVSSITVKAFNKDGTVLANKAISLQLGTIPAGLNITLSDDPNQLSNVVSKDTDADGNATFKLTYTASAGLSAEQIKALLAGIQATASYTDAAGKVTSQTTTVQFYVNQQNIERMDLVTDMTQSPTQNGGALSLKLNEKKSFQTTVTLKDRNGKPVANHQVLLSLDNIAVDNNILFRLVNFKDEAGNNVTGGLIAVQTNANGQAIVNVEALVKNQSDLDALVASGIIINASAVQGDGSLTITQTTSVRVVSEAAETVAANAVSYLTAASANSLETTSNGSTEITVRAFNAKGDPLAGKGISLALADVPAGLTISMLPTSPLSDITNANGEARFTVTYTAPPEGNLTPSQIKALLAGIAATASYTESGKVITQTTKIQFYANSATIAQDAQRLDVVTSTGTVLANSDTFTLTTTVIDRSGNPAANKFVTLSLDAASSQNGVSIASSNQLKTDTTGKVTFTINVRGATQQMIDNLVANGISLTSTVVQSNGAEIKQTTKVMAEAPQTLAVSSLVATVSHASIESTGGSSVVAVRAVDINGKPVVNQNVNFALGGINATNGRVSVDKNAGLTNAQGYVYFTVTIANGELDNNLIKDGLAYAVSTINENDGNAVSQVDKINVSVPAGTYNLLPLTPSKSNLLITGDTLTVTSKLVDDNGAPLKSQPVTLVVDNVALNGGINVEGGMNAITDVNGNVSFKITLPAKTNQAQIDELLNNGLTIKTSVTLPNGSLRYSPDLKINVGELVSQYRLNISPDKATLSVNGDKTLTVVTLLDNNNQPLKNQQVTLTARNIAGGVLINGQDVAIVTTPQTVTTDEAGRAFFSVTIPTSGFDKDLLERSNIVLDASHTDVNGAITRQVALIEVFNPNALPNQTQPARYSLRISSAKPTLNVRNDITDVTVTLIDQNGGGVADKYVTLSLDDFARNGASIFGASGLTTDANGQAVFKVKIDESARASNYSAASFASDDLRVTAKFVETGYTETTQISTLNVVQAVIANPVASIVIGANMTEVASSADGVYYSRNLSASVVDFDGRPLANQEVTLDITPLNYTKGRIFQSYQSANKDSGVLGWIRPNQRYYPTVELSAYNRFRFDTGLNNVVVKATNALATPQDGYIGFYDQNGIIKYDNGTRNDSNDDKTVTANDLNLLVDSNQTPISVIREDTTTCAASAAGTPITNAQVTDVPVKVPTFLGQGTTATYTTDAQGKFDFTIRYPKIYAQWLTVRIGAASTVSTLPTRTTYDLGLPSLITDYSADGTYGPNLISPYGTLNSCP